MLFIGSAERGHPAVGCRSEQSRYSLQLVVHQEVVSAVSWPHAPTNLPSVFGLSDTSKPGELEPDTRRLQYVVGCAARVYGRYYSVPAAIGVEDRR